VDTGSEKEVRDEYVAANTQKIVKERREVLEYFLLAENLTEEAEHHMGSFFKKYFLNDDGWPDKSKDPGVLTSDLLGTTLRYHGFDDALRNIDGLKGREVCGFDKMGHIKLICLGWDKSTVDNVGNEIASRLMKEHIASCRAEYSGSLKEEGIASQASGIAGDYIIDCDKFIDSCPLESPIFSIQETNRASQDDDDTDNWVWDAQFILPITQGALILSRTPAALTKMGMYMYKQSYEADEDSNHHYLAFDQLSKTPNIQQLAIDEKNPSLQTSKPLDPLL
jgi:hypothetical protein